MEALPATINGYICTDVKDVELAQKVIDPATRNPLRVAATDKHPVAAPVAEEELGVSHPDPRADVGRVVNVKV